MIVTAWVAARDARPDHALAPHTTYRIGGPADWYVEAGAGLAGVVAGCREQGLPLTLLGNGSNLLVADEGVEGLVCRPSATTIRVEGETLRAVAGARMVKVAQAAAAAGLTGMEWALGIPGTVGGSIHNNAGCFGSDIAATVSAVEGVAPDGAAAAWTAADCAFDYRVSAFKDGRLRGAVVTGASFALTPGDPAAVRARMAEIQRMRHETQPVTGRSTGSVFKNPPGDFAGRLVEAAGLKGRQVGGAMVSREHANFIVNTGHAKASDVAELVLQVQQAVEERFATRLQPEIEAIGRWPGGLPEAFRVAS